MYLKSDTYSLTSSTNFPKAASADVGSAALIQASRIYSVCSFLTSRMIFTHFCHLCSHLLVGPAKGTHGGGTEGKGTRLLNVATVSIATFAWQQLLRGEKRNTGKHPGKTQHG